MWLYTQIKILIHKQYSITNKHFIHSVKNIISTGQITKLLKTFIRKLIMLKTIKIVLI